MTASALCSPCAPGTFANASDATACLVCDGPHAASEAGADRCGCEPGYAHSEFVSASYVCSSHATSAPSCEVVISGLTTGSGFETRITIDVVNTDFSSSDEYISSVMAGSYSLGSGFLASGGEDDYCGMKSRILDAVLVPGSAITGGQMTVRISTTNAVGCCECSGKTLLASLLHLGSAVALGVLLVHCVSFE